MHYPVSGNGASVLPLDRRKMHCLQYPCLMKGPQLTVGAAKVLQKVAFVCTPKMLGKLSLVPTAQPAQDNSLNISFNGTRTFWD